MTTPPDSSSAACAPLRAEDLAEHYGPPIIGGPLFGFLPGSDERMKNTVDAISSELSENGFVLRYVTGETDDGLSGKEGTLLICSFWLVSALTIVGEMRRKPSPTSPSSKPPAGSSSPTDSRSGRYEPHRHGGRPCAHPRG